jgi:hypothetical protein
VRRPLLVAVGAVALATVLGSAMARADTLWLGGPFNTIVTSAGTVGGGSIESGTLNGIALPWVFCVDFYDDVTVPGLYSNATVTHDGTIAGSSLNSTHGGVDGYSVDGQLALVHNDVVVAWLLHNYATSPMTQDAQIGLQAAIWNVIYGITLTGNSATAQNAYNADLAALQAAKGAGLTNYVAEFVWLSPSGKDHTPVRQGLVSRVPDGGVTLMLLGGVLVGLETLRRKLAA